jgi:predicted dehydrogenase
MQTVRTALVGCGKVGQLHAAALKSLPESELVAVCDSNPGRAAAYAERYGANPYTDLGTLFRDSGAQVVLGSVEQW